MHFNLAAVKKKKKKKMLRVIENLMHFGIKLWRIF